MKKLSIVILLLIGSNMVLGIVLELVRVVSWETPCKAAASSQASCNNQELTSSRTQPEKSKFAAPQAAVSGETVPAAFLDRMYKFVGRVRNLRASRLKFEELEVNVAEEVESTTHRLVGLPDANTVSPPLKTKGR